jgi:predicted DNA-binding transcriptional regulator AlpA
MATDVETIDRPAAVCARLHVGRQTLDRLVRDGKFPKPIKLGKRAQGWPKSAVDKFIAENFKAANPE